MSELTASNLQPSDSASNIAAKKSKRPGKAQRNANRSDVTAPASAATGPTSYTGQSLFARKASFAPVPQPGKFPVVFPSGAGEPTRDSRFAYDGVSLNKCFSHVAKDYVGSAKYAEFSTNADYQDIQFHKDLVAAALCSLAQQTVHAHANIGQSIGDFSAIASTDTFIMSSLKSVVSQFGEFSVESLGTRFILADYASEVTALVRTAHKVLQQDNIGAVSTIMKQHWLPVKPGDERTAFIVASKLSDYFKRFNVILPVNSLASAVFSGEESTAYTAVKNLLPEGSRNIFDALFNSYTSKAEFAAMFDGEPGTRILTELGLTWVTRGANTLNWEIVPKVRFPEIMDAWTKKKPTITKFFTCSTGLADRSTASGTPAQLAEVGGPEGVTVIKSLVAVSAPEFSLLACYPPTVLSEWVGDRNVVLTTSIPVKIRATEFAQLDWLG